MSHVGPAVVSRATTGPGSVGVMGPSAAVVPPPSNVPAASQVVQQQNAQQPQKV